MHLIISCSLNKKSKSRIMAKHAHSLHTENSKYIDLKDFDMPLCDGNSCYNHPVTKDLKNIIEGASSILISGPIYNYDLNAAVKNLLELTGQSWNNKLVGFICAAGGKGSYMSPMSFMNSLILDYRCMIIPRYVYADSTCFDEKGQFNEEIKNRIEEVVNSSIKLHHALSTIKND